MVITSGENGILVPVNDDRAMADAINQLIEKPDVAKKLSREAAKIGLEAAPERIFNQWQEYLEEICRRYQ